MKNKFFIFLLNKLNSLSTFLLRQIVHLLFFTYLIAKRIELIDESLKIDYGMSYGVLRFIMEK